MAGHLSGRRIVVVEAAGAAVGGHDVAVAEKYAGWVLDEFVHAGRENLDPAHVARYDAKEDAEAGAELAMLLEAGIGPDSVVVDIGAGTGQFALACAPTVARVIAVDVSPVMLAALRASILEHGPRNIECVEGGFLTYEHRGDPVDLIYSRYALHHLPDFWKAIALGRLAAILRPGGFLRLCDVVYQFDPADAPARLEEWMAATESEDVDEGWTRPELEEHVRDEHSTFTWLLEPILVRVGVQHRARAPQRGRDLRSLPLRQAIAVAAPKGPHFGLGTPCGTSGRHAPWIAKVSAGARPTLAHKQASVSATARLTLAQDDKESRRGVGRKAVRCCIRASWDNSRDETLGIVARSPPCAPTTLPRRAAAGEQARATK